MFPTNSHYIEFPALGWHFPLNDTLVQFSLFDHTFTIKWYGLLIAIGFMLAVLYGLSRAKELGIDPDRLIDATLVCTLLGFIGARLYYVFFCADTAEYLANPISILQIWHGGIGIYGGVIAAFLSGLLMCKICKLPLFATFDLASLGFLIGQAVGRWGNFFNQEAFGGNTTLPWGMTGDMIAAGTNGTGYDTTLPVHPTFLYESLWCILGFVLLHILSKKMYKFKGQIFCGYLIWYGVGRFMIESTRTDSLMIGTMKTSQLVAVIAVIGGIVMGLILRRRSLSMPMTLEAEGGTLNIETPAAEEVAEEPAETVAPAEEPAAEPAVAEEDTDGTDH